MKRKDRRIDSPGRSVTVSERAVKYDINVYAISLGLFLTAAHVSRLLLWHVKPREASDRERS